MTEQAEQLRNALLAMVGRYGASEYRAAHGGPGANQGRHVRAARRQYQAIMRLSRALAELSART